MLKAVRAILGATLVMAAVSACNDDPLSEGREDAAYFKLNPSVAVVDAGGQTVITAIVANRYGAAIDAPVTATTCDNRIAAAIDTLPRRTAFEPPERFRVTGVTVGETCLVVSGGGITDTVTVRVVPVGMRIVGDSILQSGVDASFNVEFLNAAGQVVTGLTAADVEFSLDPATRGEIDGNTISPQVPGDATLTITLKEGAVRLASRVVTVVPGPFQGTFAPTSPGVAQQVTFTAGEIQFDDDTFVQFDGVPAPLISRTPEEMTVIVPGGAQLNTHFDIANLGAGQVAVGGDMTLSSTDDPYDPNYDTSEAGVWASVDTTYWLVLEEDEDTYFALTSPVAGNVNFIIEWNEPERFVGFYGSAADESWTRNQCFFLPAGSPRPPRISCTMPVSAGLNYINVWDYGAVDTYDGSFLYGANTVSVTVSMP